MGTICLYEVTCPGFDCASVKVRVSQNISNTWCSKKNLQVPTRLEDLVKDQLNTAATLDDGIDPEVDNYFYCQFDESQQKL